MCRRSNLLASVNVLREHRRVKQLAALGYGPTGPVVDDDALPATASAVDATGGADTAATDVHMASSRRRSLRRFSHQSRGVAQGGHRRSVSEGVARRRASARVPSLADRSIDSKVASLRRRLDDNVLATPHVGRRQHFLYAPGLSCV